MTVGPLGEKLNFIHHLLNASLYQCPYVRMRGKKSCKKEVMNKDKLKVLNKKTQGTAQDT